jgi:hypothetical protein
MFKKGDKVRVIHNNDGKRFGNHPRMDKYVGRIFTVVTANGGQNILDCEHGDGEGHNAGFLWSWDDTSLESINSLHVGDWIRWRDGQVTYKIAKCLPDNRFDLVCIDQIDVDVANWQILPKYVGNEVFVLKKYHLRNAKGHFMLCEQWLVKPPNAPVKRAKPKAKGVIAPKVKKAAKPVVPATAIIAPAYDLRKELARRAGNGTCNYALEFTKSPPRMQHNDVCHARLCWGYSEVHENKLEGDEIVNIALNVKPHYAEMGDVNKKTYKLFIHYMLNESPWAFCFITKDVEEALNVGILMDVDQNVSHLVGAAISLRTANEHQRILPVFQKCIDMGYSGNTSFLTSGWFMEGGRTTIWPGHNSLRDGLIAKYVFKFFKEGYAKKLPGIRKDTKQIGYKIYETICNTGKYVNQYDDNPGQETFSQFVQKHRVERVEGKGFARKTINDYEASVKNVADAINKEIT